MLRVLSLGAGVQSSTLLLMAARGEFDAVPDAAIFADTGWEPRTVYDWLDWLEEEVRGVIPIRRVSAGNIREETLSAARGERTARTPPLFVLGSDGRAAPATRQCTKEYKIEPIRAELRRMIGLRPRQRAPKELAVEQWFGISADEIGRCRVSEDPWQTFRYPLIERAMTRLSCLRWMERNGYPRPPKSACIGCPYHSDAMWREIRDTEPGEWADAVEFDRAIRSGTWLRFKGEPYLHRSLRPLDEVDLSTVEERGQGNLFDDGMLAECEGMCGV